MSSPHRPLDPRSGFVLDTHSMGRRAGAMSEVRRSVEAPDGLGSDVIGVPPGSPLELDLRLESVIEGVLVSGTASMTLRGQCVRCLQEIDEPLEIDLQELFAYPESGATEDEASRLEGELIDLEPLLRDDVVLSLPFQPLCRDDCVGLCPDCGADLNDDPDQDHEAPIDPRWAALRAVSGPAGEAEAGDEAAADNEAVVREHQR